MVYLIYIEVCSLKMMVLPLPQ